MVKCPTEETFAHSFFCHSGLDPESRNCLKILDTAPAFAGVTRRCDKDAGLIGLCKSPTEIWESEVSLMNVKYVIDDSGKRSAVIVPLKEWESIMAKINVLREDLDVLSPEDEIDRQETYGELNRGETLNLREAMKNW